MILTSSPCWCRVQCEADHPGNANNVAPVCCPQSAAAQMFILASGAARSLRNSKSNQLFLSALRRPTQTFCSAEIQFTVNTKCFPICHPTDLILHLSALLRSSQSLLLFLRRLLERMLMLMKMLFLYILVFLHSSKMREGR